MEMTPEEKKKLSRAFELACDNLLCDTISNKCTEPTIECIDSFNNMNFDNIAEKYYKLKRDIEELREKAKQFNIDFKLFPLEISKIKD